MESFQGPWLAQQQIGVLEGAVPGKAPSRLTVWTQRLPRREPANYPARSRGCVVAMDGSCTNYTWSSRDESHPRRPAGCERGITAEAVSELCRQGQLTEAVEALGVLVKTDWRVSRNLLYAVLKSCVVKKDLVLGRRVHALTVETGYELDTFLCSHILRMYAFHGWLQDAVDVFTMVANPDAFMCSAMISALVKHGQDKQAIQLYHRMRRSGVKPDGYVFVAALQACARGSDLKTGQQLHADVLACGVEPDLFVSSCLVDMYAKCGSLEEARKVFDELREKNVVTWTALIAGYSQQGMGQEALRLYSCMQVEGVAVPNSVTYVCLLQACACVGGTHGLDMGKQLHSQIRREGRQADVFVANSLVNMYAKCGSLEEAQRVFDGLGQKDVVTWNAMIAGFAQQGRGQEALHLFSLMEDEGITLPDCVTFVSVLQACASLGAAALEKGKQLHTQIAEQVCQTDAFVANSLVNMYAKCGSLKDAQRVFDGLCEKDVVTWNVMIAGYSQQAMGEEALQLYSLMQGEGTTTPDCVTFVGLLQACAMVGGPALEKGKQFHTEIKERGLEADAFVANTLVNMYAKCGSLEDAQNVFDRLSRKDGVTWTALIAGYAEQDMGQEALRLYSSMQGECISVHSSVTFVSLLQAFASVGTEALDMGKDLHAQIREQGREAEVFVANSLVHMYAKCGSLADAQTVFDGLVRKDVVTWTSLIAGYSQQGMGQESLHLYTSMQEEGLAVPNPVTFVCLLQACASVGSPALETGKELHMQIRERGHEADLFVASSLVKMYAKCGSLEDARRVFEGLGQRDVVTWTTLIAEYSQQGMGQEALDLFRDMQEEDISVPNSATFGYLLQACAIVGAPALEIGNLLHAQMKEGGHETDTFAASSLISMYAKCSSLDEAQRVFDELGHKDVGVWNAMIAGYSQQSMGQEALHVFLAMQNKGPVAPNGMTYVFLLQACSTMGTKALAMGKRLHQQIIDEGHQSDVFVASSLVNMYAKIGSLEDAQRVFDGLSQKDVVTWTALISGYFQQGIDQGALRLYRAMGEEGIAIDNSITFVLLLQSSANVAALHVGRQLHVQIEEQGLQADAFVVGSLINMYGKCGSMVDAQQVFDALPSRNAVAWNALIAGYSHQGDSSKVFDLVNRMRQDGIQPIGITFLALLVVCSHTGQVTEGRECFQAMSSDYAIDPTVEHYTCMVDLLGRAGRLDEAQSLIKTMPVPPNAAVWHSLLGSCQKWSNVEVGLLAFDQAVSLDEKDDAAYTLMSNIYTSAQLWERALEIQARRKRIRAFKQPGQSWWTDLNGRVQKFSSLRKKHPKNQAMHKQMLQQK